jgi:lantibiotic modifying enzyme
MSNNESSFTTEPAAVETDMSRRSFLIAGGLLFVTAAGLSLEACTSSEKPQPSQNNHPSNSLNETTPSNPEINPSIMLKRAGQSLLDQHEEADGGWRFQSVIQAPHYQTDRDVGASSVGMGFLVMADKYPEDHRWLQAAEQTAGWLMAVEQKDSNGVHWTDYVDDNEKASATYVSFDDGTIGISDYFWRLYTKTRNPAYKDTAISALEWTFAQAKNTGTDQPEYSWQWNTSDSDSEYYMGMGEGAVGLVHTFATYYERLRGSDPAVAAQCKQYIDGTLRYINSVRSALGNNDGDARALPETGVIGRGGDTEMNAGYLSGSAGAAFMYLKLYKVFGDKQYLAEADQLFSWLEDKEDGPLVVPGPNMVAWKLALDPQGGDNPVLATGFEEGAAGIGWAYLQAYKVTGDPKYLGIAKQAGNWLSSVAVHEHNGVTWHEYESPAKPTVHANLNNGAAGIGMFLLDLAESSHDSTYHDLAVQAFNWLTETAQRDQKNNIYWNDNDGDDDYSHDPSWHWGTAGIIAFLAKIDGGKTDIPGEQPAL